MKHGFNVFDPLLDLKRNYFLEASAGTGKTFTIENLIVRLLEDGLEMDQILVVTFTRAASLELKIRIRRNLEAKQLNEPLTHFDEAQIFTIHGFCFSLLQEFALETGFPIYQAEEGASPEALSVILKDYLRTGLTSEQIHPKQLEMLVSRCYGNIESLLSELMSINTPSARTYSEIQNQLQSAISELDRESYSTETLISLASNFSGLCDRKRVLKTSYEEGFYRFMDLLNGKDANPIDLPITKMVPENLLRKYHYPEILKPLNQKIIPLLCELSDSSLILNRLAKGAQDYLKNYSEKEDFFLYDDLLKKVAAHTEDSSFCQKVRERYKTVLIDEFQDTDTLQWEIFSKLFLGHVPLYVVGDPKQSIYRFRGADLYVYNAVKTQFGENAHATLDRNFRASPPLINALNFLFERGQNLITLPKIQEVIPIPKIEAGTSDRKSGGIIFCKANHEEELFSHIFHEIERMHREEKIPYREFAILVKDRYQAKRFSSCCPLPCVNKRSESLVESEAFAALKDLLFAIYHPRDRHAICKALGGPLFGLSIEELIIQDEEQALFFFDYHQILCSQGLLPLFYHLKERLVFPNHSFYLDFLQLIEMLSELSSYPNYLSYLDRLKEEHPESDILKARAKCGEDAIQVMTLHVSKGLEFEVVFPIALICSVAMEDEEERSEKMRQLYVAMTRAKRFLYLPISDQKNTPMDFFLSQILHGEDLSTFVQGSPYLSHQICLSHPFIKTNPDEEHIISTAEKRLRFPPCQMHSFSSLYPNISSNEQTYPSNDMDMPAGSQTGTLLHLLFEKLNFNLAQNDLTDYLEKELKDTLLESWQTSIEEIVWNTLHSPLEAPSQTFLLSQIDPKKMIREMEFIYPSLDETGYLKGFIDLFFEHGDRYYLIDWKSNRLADYRHKSLEGAMSQHHYKHQAKIYSQAAKKYLNLFGLEHKFEGIFYLFVRGIKLNSKEGVYFQHEIN